MRWGLKAWQYITLLGQLFQNNWLVPRLSGASQGLWALYLKENRIVGKLEEGWLRKMWNEIDPLQKRIRPFPTGIILPMYRLIFTTLFINMTEETLELNWFILGWTYAKKKNASIDLISASENSKTMPYMLSVAILSDALRPSCNAECCYFRCRWQGTIWFYLRAAII